MLSLAQELEHKTRLYWRLQQVKRGHSKEKFTIKQSLDVIRNTLNTLQPTFLVYKRFITLRDDIIREPSRRQA